jgi:hypothetical protein
LVAISMCMALALVLAAPFAMAQSSSASAGAEQTPDSPCPLDIDEFPMGTNCGEGGGYVLPDGSTVIPTVTPGASHEICEVDGMSYADWFGGAGKSNSTFNRHRKALLQDGTVIHDEAAGTYSHALPNNSHGGNGSTRQDRPYNSHYSHHPTGGSSGSTDGGSVVENSTPANRAATIDGRATLVSEFLLAVSAEHHDWRAWRAAVALGTVDLRVAGLRTVARDFLERASDAFRLYNFDQARKREEARRAYELSPSYVEAMAVEVGEPYRTPDGKPTPKSNAAETAYVLRRVSELRQDGYHTQAMRLMTDIPAPYEPADDAQTEWAMIQRAYDYRTDEVIAWGLYAESATGYPMGAAV